MQATITYINKIDIIQITQQNFFKISFKLLQKSKIFLDHGAEQLQLPVLNFNPYAL